MNEKNKIVAEQAEQNLQHQQINPENESREISTQKDEEQNNKLIEKKMSLIQIEKKFQQPKKIPQSQQQQHNQTQDQKQSEMNSHIQIDSQLQLDKLKYENQSNQPFPQQNESKLINQNFLQKEIQVTQFNKQLEFQIEVDTQNQLIRNQNEQIIAILYENEIFYLKQKQKLKSNNQVFGKLFRTNFDKNSNPRFLIQEGKFDLEISKGRVHYYLNDDKGIEYQGKSKEVKFKGKFINGRYSLIPVAFKPKKIKIQEINSVQLINLPNNRENIKNQKLKQEQEWLKYNQRITQRDLQILELKQKKWVTSSILDSFCCYLNKQSEARYFKMNKKDRSQVNRILFVPSSLISSFGDCTQAQQLLKQQFLEFEQLQYRLNEIFRYVGFIINKNQTHWQFVYFDFHCQNIYEFDSLGGRVSNNILKALIYFFQKYLPQKFEKLKYNYIRQNDSYSCGLHVANFMNFMYERQFDNEIELKYSEEEIKTKLFNLFKQ